MTPPLKMLGPKIIEWDPDKPELSIESKFNTEILTTAIHMTLQSIEVVQSNIKKEEHDPTSQQRQAP